MSLAQVGGPAAGSACSRICEALKDKGRTCIQVPFPGWSRFISDDLEELVEKDGADKLGGIGDELEEGGKESIPES